MDIKAQIVTSDNNHEAPHARARSVLVLNSDPPGPEPPDSGWAWLVLLGTFIVTLNSIGFVVGLGVFFLYWKDEFETTSAAISVVITLGSFIRGLTSPVAGALITKFSPRVIMMAGGLISFVGILLTSFGTSISFLVGTIGIMAAVGFSMSFNASFVMLQRYFKKRYSTAVSLALAGISVGQMVLPPLYTWFITEFGWRGAMMIIAGICLNTVVAGALMRPVSVKRVQKKKMKPNQDADPRREETEDPEHAKPSAQEDGSQRDIKNDADDIKPGLAEPQTKNGELFEFGDTSVLVEQDVNSTACQTEIGDTKDCGSDLEDLPASRNDPCDPSTPSTCTITEDRTTGLGVAVTHTKADSLFGYVKLYFQRSKTFLLETYGLRRLPRNLCFIIVCFAAFAQASGLAIINVHIIPKVEYEGIDSETASVLLSIIGATGIVSRFVGGWITDKHLVTVEMTYAILLLASGLVASLIPLLNTFAQLAVVSALFGLFAGSPGSLLVVTLREIVRPSEAAAAMGILMLWFGLGEIAGASLAGFLFDETNIYDYSFYCSCGSTIVAGILALINYFLLKVKSKRLRAKAAAAASLENPDLLAEGDHNLSSGVSALTTTVTSTASTHEAVNPLYFTERGESASRGKFNLPKKINWSFRQGQRQKYRLEMSHITRIGDPGTFCQRLGDEVVDNRQEVDNDTGEVNVNEDKIEHTISEHDNVSFENPAFLDEEESAE